MKKILLLISLLCVSSFALATQDHTCQGGHNCNSSSSSSTSSSGSGSNSSFVNTNTATGGNSTSNNTNNLLNTNALSNTSSNANVNTALGGVGGNGGAGGSANSSNSIGNGVGNFSPTANGGSSSIKDSGNSFSNSNATGGSVKDSGNSFSNSSNKNDNTNAQGQQQGQIGINKSSNKNSSNSVSQGGNATGGNATGGNATQGQIGINKNGDQSNTQGDQTQSNNQNVGDIVINNGLSEEQARDLAAPDDNSVNVNNETTYEAPKIPVATAYAPGLTATEDTCMGSTSAGGQGITLGLSFGTTWSDKDCVTRKDSRFLFETGHRALSLSLMCGKEDVRAAVARGGNPEQIAVCALSEKEIQEYRDSPVTVSSKRKSVK